jgi:hypothetical protein
LNIAKYSIIVARDPEIEKYAFNLVRANCFKLDERVIFELLQVKVIA